MPDTFRWRDLRWLVSGEGLSGVAGTMAVTVSLLPLDLPLLVRLAIGIAGAVMTGIALPRAWRWVRDGSSGGTGTGQ